MRDKAQIVGNTDSKSNSSKKSIHYFYGRCYLTHQMEWIGTVISYT